MVDTMVLTIFAQPYPESVWAHHRRVVDHLAELGLNLAAYPLTTILQPRQTKRTVNGDMLLSALAPTHSLRVGLTSLKPLSSGFSLCGANLISKIGQDEAAHRLRQRHDDAAF